MKKILFIFFLIPACIYSQNTHKKINTLFLGNSYTYVNNLPQLIYSIAIGNGDTLVYDGNLIGGYSFNNHYTDAVSQAKINARHWDFVVLQAQSQEPSFPPSQVNAQTMPYAIKLDSAVKNNYSCTTTVFYETWGRKNGDASNCGFYPPLCTYTGMQNRLRESYKKFADTTNALMAPAGEAFRKSIALNPSLELYDPDQSHPSINGSYLVACVLYEMLFQKSVLSSTYNPGLTASTLAFLQQTAHSTLTDSLYTWNIGKNLPWADFSFSQLSSSSFQFQSPTTNNSNAWYFGDGATSFTSLNPAHYYTNPGTYTVSHVVDYGCKKDSVSKVVTVIATGIQNQENARDEIVLYPNPCAGTLFIKDKNWFANNEATIEIRNTLGQMVYNSEFKEVISTESLKNGHYFIKVFNNKSTFNTHFIKNE